MGVKVAGTARHDARERGLRLVRFGLATLSILTAVVVWVNWYGAGDPVDARAFYDPDYSRPDYLYLWSPAFAQLTAPFRLLPFDAFVGLVRGIELIALVALIPYGAWLAIFLPPVAAEINAANINLALIGCVVLSLRWPAAWLLPLITKPSMGVGLLWYPVRREWRKLAIAVGATAAIVAVSFALDPVMWVAWAGQLLHASDKAGWPFPWPVWPRLPVAAVVVIWGARTNRPWTVPLAAIIAMPRFYFLSIAMFVGLLPLMRPRPLAIEPVPGPEPAPVPEPPPEPTSVAPPV